MDNIKQAEKLIGFAFKNSELLKTALTHSSYANEQGTENNGRLEFLGDSVLGLIISEYLFKHSAEPEGKLTVFKSNIVNKTALSGALDKSGIVKYMFMGASLKDREEKYFVSIKEDLFESITGAIFLDGGLNAAKKFVFKFLSISELINCGTDYKTELQEYAQKNNHKPVYKTKKSGQGFVSEVFLNGRRAASGSGTSKKQAEKEAAKIALTELTQSCDI